MDYIENTDTQSTKKFTNRFMIVYAIGLIIIFPLIFFISEIVGIFLPTAYKTIVSFICTTFGLWKINSVAIKKSLEEANITSQNIKDILRKINIFFTIILISNLLFSFIFFGFPALWFSNFKSLFCTSFVLQAIAIIIQYVLIMLLCKNDLESKIFEKKINKLTLYRLILCIAILFISIGSLISGDKNVLFPLKTIKDAKLANQYANSKWEEIGCSTSTEKDFTSLTSHISLGHYEKNMIKEYRVVKIVCTAYDEKNNAVIGKTEKYYKNVKLNYGYFSFRRNIEIRLTKPSYKSLEIKAYGIPK